MINLLTVGDFNTSFTRLDRSYVQTINSVANDIVHQVVIIDIYRLFHLNTKEFTFSTVPNRSFSKKTNFNKLSKI